MTDRPRTLADLIAAAQRWEIERAEVSAQEDAADPFPHPDTWAASDDWAAELAHDLAALAPPVEPGEAPPPILADVRDVAAAAALALGEAWADNEILSAIAEHLTRGEVEPLAHLLAATGHGAAADVLLDQWIETEITDNDAAPGDWMIYNHTLWRTGDSQ